MTLSNGTVCLNTDEHHEVDGMSIEDGNKENSDPKTCDDGAVAGVLPSKLNFVVDNKDFKAKRKKIEDCLGESPVSHETLVELAISPGGLVDDKYRKVAWPLLLGIMDMSSPPAPSEEQLLAHPEHQQVVLDVNRSLKRFPPGIHLEERLRLQDELTRLILRVVTVHPRLRYYQGYHDVAVTLLLVAGENASFFLLERLSKNHLKDCMEATMEKTSYLLHYIYPLIRHQDKKVFEHMEKSEVGTTYALPWFITWFGHSLNYYKDVVRLYDFFLASEPLAPLYLSSVLIVHRSVQILETPCDMASLYALLSKIPDDIPFETLIQKTVKLYKKYPPKIIEKEVKVRVEEEQRQRDMERAVRQARMARVVHPRSPFWRLLGRIDPVRRLPLWAFPYAHRLPNAVRRYQYVVVTAFAVGVWAMYSQALEGGG